MNTCSICRAEMPSGPARCLDRLEVCSAACFERAWLQVTGARTADAVPEILGNHDACWSGPESYDADYYLRGKETGKSLYEDYRWMPEVTVPMAMRIAEHCGIEKSHTVMDFGCARGYLVKAFRALGYDAFGVDCSRWAVENCDPEVRNFVFHKEEVPRGLVDWVIAKDVLEHVPQAADCVARLMDAAKLGVFAVVPLSATDGAPYVVPDYELDSTHVHRLTLASWARMFCRVGWEVTASYRVPGVKANYQGWRTWVADNVEKWADGNGFVVARRQ